jgi:hypothetical protein
MRACWVSHSPAAAQPGTNDHQGSVFARARKSIFEPPRTAGSTHASITYRLFTGTLALSAGSISALRLRCTS